MQDRVELLKLTVADEEALGASRITDWRSPPFFETNFWFMWATTFAFQPWHSAVEFKRYLHRFMLEFTQIETLAGVKRTIFDQSDSLVQPLLRWLEGEGVQSLTGCTVTDIVLQPGAAITVNASDTVRDGEKRTVAVAGQDIVVFENGSMTDALSFGSMTEALPRLTKQDSQGWTLWETLAKGRPAAYIPSKAGTCAASSSLPSVSTCAAIWPVLASAPRCSLSQRLRNRPCLAAHHSPWPNSSSPVLSSTRCIDPMLAPHAADTSRMPDPAGSGWYSPAPPAPCRAAAGRCGRTLPLAAGPGGTRAAGSGPARSPGQNSAAVRPACSGAAPAIPPVPPHPPRTSGHPDGVVPPRKPASS